MPLFVHVRLCTFVKVAAMNGITVKTMMYLLLVNAFGKLLFVFGCLFIFGRSHQGITRFGTRERVNRRHSIKQ